MFVSAAATLHEPTSFRGLPPDGTGGRPALTDVVCRTRRRIPFPHAAIMTGSASYDSNSVLQSMKVQIPGVFVLVGGEGVTSVSKEVSISRGEREVASHLPEDADAAPGSQG